MVSTALLGYTQQPLAILDANLSIGGLQWSGEPTNNDCEKWSVP